MNDDATQILREIRDLIRDTAARDGAWIAEMRSNQRRLRRLIWFVMLPLLFIVTAILVYSMMQPANSAGQELPAAYHLKG
jgi:hypothetical protein